MCNQPFEYMEEVEVSNNNYMWQSTPIRSWFLAYAKDHPSPYITIMGDRSIKAWRHCRRPRPNLKKGQPVLFSNGANPTRGIGFFDGWTNDGRLRTSTGDVYDNYALLKDYDYEADINEGI